MYIFYVHQSYVYKYYVNKPMCTNIIIFLYVSKCLTNVKNMWMTGFTMSDILFFSFAPAQIFKTIKCK